MVVGPRGGWAEAIFEPLPGQLVLVMSPVVPLAVTFRGVRASESLFLEMRRDAGHQQPHRPERDPGGGRLDGPGVERRAMVRAELGRPTWARAGSLPDHLDSRSGVPRGGPMADRAGRSDGATRDTLGTNGPTGAAILNGQWGKISGHRG